MNICVYGWYDISKLLQEMCLKIVLILVIAHTSI